jgi:hypothetical protein
VGSADAADAPRDTEPYRARATGGLPGRRRGTPLHHITAETIGDLSGPITSHVAVTDRNTTRWHSGHPSLPGVL